MRSLEARQDLAPGRIRSVRAGLGARWARRSWAAAARSGRPYRGAARRARSRAATNLSEGQCHDRVRSFQPRPGPSSSAAACRAARLPIISQSSAGQDIVLLERKQLTCGTTWHAAGLIGQLRGSQNMTRLAKYSADLYVRLEAETGVATGMRQVGSITVALTEAPQGGNLPAGHAGARLRRRRPRDRPDEVKEMYPHLNVVGRGRRRCTCRSTASAIRQTSPWRWPRARGRTARRSSRTSRSTGVRQADGRVTGVDWQQGGDEGTIEADVVVNCAGMWARDLARDVGRDAAAACLRALLHRDRTHRRAWASCRCCACRTSAPITRKTPAR